MKIAITGEKGFVGTHLRLYIEKIKNYELVELGKDYLQSLDKLSDGDWLIHGASVHRNPNPEMVYVENMRIHNELVSFLLRRNIVLNIVFLSTIQENDLSPYGKSKRDGKRILLDYCLNSGSKFISHVLPNLFGAYAIPNKYSFVATFCYNIIQNIPCSYNKNLVNLYYVKDAVKNILLFDDKVIFDSRQISVEEVYLNLKTFNEKYFIEKEIPDFNNQFELNLFNTLLSYVDYKL